MRLGEWVDAAALQGAVVLEAIAALIILLAAVRGGFRVVQLSWVRRMGPRADDTVRLEMGENLSLALDFLVGADVLRTAVAPNWNDIGKLGAIVVIRSALNFFLERERKSIETGFIGGGNLRKG
jgi:uncharacterized membrane protein